jgi:hypothetical protein
VGYRESKGELKKEKVKLILALQAKANSNVFASQAAIQVTVMIKNEALGTVRDLPAGPLQEVVSDMWSQGRLWDHGRQRHHH